MRRRQPDPARAQAGFSIVEMIAMIAVTATVIGAGIATYVGTLRSWQGTAGLAHIQREASLAMDVVTRSIREASSVIVAGDGDSLNVYYETAGGESLGAVYYRGGCSLLDANGDVVVPNVSSVGFTSDGRTVNIDITLVDDRGTPDNTSDDQMTLMSSSVSCRN
ncbi:MAG: hypothetical protein FJY74_06085 [Candidatus Eisenbacteria bacterium]|nr:hypothetical protein [Candidatus Eisenbacteria bacterium]